jgi:hypothetical protein
VTALATTTENAGSVAQYADSLLNVIASAARDPNVDIDKMERLIAMQERVQDRNAKAAYFAALAQMQPGLPVIAERGGIKDRSGNVQSTYALWEDVNEAIRPALAKHGFALSFRVKRTEAEIIVTGILSHREGHSEETELSLPTDTSGSKNAVQAVGSSTSYGKRYTAYALLNITSTGEDDDGHRAGMAPVEMISAGQCAELRRLIASAGTTEEAFCARVKAGTLPEIAADAFERVKGVLMRRIEAKLAEAE